MNDGSIELTIHWTPSKAQRTAGSLTPQCRGTRVCNTRCENDVRSIRSRTQNENVGIPIISGPVRANTTGTVGRPFLQIKNHISFPIFQTV